MDMETEIQMLAQSMTGADQGAGLSCGTVRGAVGTN